jgi:hypothetical protein
MRTSMILGTTLLRLAGSWQLAERMRRLINEHGINERYNALQHLNVGQRK